MIMYVQVLQILLCMAYASILSSNILSFEVDI